MRLHHLSHPTLSITKWLLQTITVWDHFVYNWQYKIHVEMTLSDSKNNHAAPHDIKTDVMVDPNKIYLLKQNYLWLLSEKSALIKFSVSLFDQWLS